VAQNNDIRFNLVEANSGEPLGNITGITQDPHGYMWFSGQGAKCLYRYDGNRMISFRHDSLNINSLGGTNLETVYADVTGTIWIGFFDGGLDMFNPSTEIFKHYINKQSDPGSLSAGMVNVILRDHKGTLWVGTANGLDRLDEKTGKFIHYRNEPGNPSSLSSNIVRAIYEDRKGVLWVGTGFPFDRKRPDDGGLNRMEPDGTFTRYLHDPSNPNSLINNKVRSIFEDSRGIFWIGTGNNGLHTMDRKKGIFQRYAYDPARPDQLSAPPVKPGMWFEHITFIKEDGSGAIWIGTYKSGVNRYDPLTKKVTHYESSNGYLDNSAWMAYTSGDGVLWLSATEGEPNLYRVDPFNKTIKNIFTRDRALSFCEDRKGFLWIGLGEAGLQQYDQKKNLVYHFKHDALDSFSLLGNNIYSIFQNQSDTLSLCTSEGIILFDKIRRHFTRFSFNGEYSDVYTKEIHNIIQDKQGLKWFATLGGLIHYNPKNASVKKYVPDAKDSGSISSARITCVMEDRSGNIWAGAWLGGGVNLLNKQTDHFRHYLKGLNTTCLYEDSKGIIWAGTEKGLYRFDKHADNFSAFFDPQSDIGTVIVNDIVEDNSKNLWISTVSAIIKLDFARAESFVYGKKFGIDANGLLRGGIYKTSRGEILVGNHNGFYSFFPEELTVNIKPLKIIITDLFINNLKVFAGNGSPLMQPIEETGEITLKHNQNNLSFNFAAIDYRSPESNKYFTMLENYDNTWREASGDRSSFYFNVPPGKYVFRVKAFNSDGIKSEKAITIILTPPWWSRWWFRIVAALSLFALFYGVIRWRLQQKFRVRLERSEKERQVSELKQKATELEMQALRAQMNPHFIFNSLNSINRFILQNNRAQASEYLTKFSKLVRLILQNSQASLIPLESELESLELYLNLEALRFNYHFDYKVSVPKDMDISALQVPPLILQPYVENAIWHGLMHKEEKGQLDIEVSEEDDHLYFKITDNGIGREKAAALASKSATKHKSMGLRITAHRIAIIQKSQTLESPVTINDLVNADGTAAGTEVTIKMPVIYD
jgi:ligand-binding sensor domain-containing protein